MRLRALPGSYAIARLPATEPLPEWAEGAFVAVVRTPQELSIVAEASRVPPDVTSEPGWRLLEVEGPLAFSEVGVLVSITAPLADAGVSIFAISTFDTDYVLVRQDDLERALTALEGAGHEVMRVSSG